MAQLKHGQQTLGPILAQELMAEILAQAYKEPVDTPKFGRESESGSDRSLWDDVDDYDGWNASPPKNKQGLVLPGLEGWGRKVVVCRVGSSELNTKVGFETGLKRIDVTVTYNGRPVTTLQALRTNGWAAAEGSQTGQNQSQSGGSLWELLFQ